MYYESKCRLFGFASRKLKLIVFCHETERTPICTNTSERMCELWIDAMSSSDGRRMCFCQFSEGTWIRDMRNKASERMKQNEKKKKQKIKSSRDSCHEFRGLNSYLLCNQHRLLTLCSAAENALMANQADASPVWFALMDLMGSVPHIVMMPTALRLSAPRKWKDNCYYYVKLKSKID